MKIENLRSPREMVGGLVYFGRMIDKIRLNLQGALPADYQTNLGKGFDERCVSFLKVPFDGLVERVKQGGPDAEILAWCFAHGSSPGEEQIEYWNAFMAKRGWRDDATERLDQRKKEAGIEGRTDVQTFFDLIDADEERLK
jgi:hypothetical protein